MCSDKGPRVSNSAAWNPEFFRLRIGLRAAPRRSKALPGPYRRGICSGRCWTRGRPGIECRMPSSAQSLWRERVWARRGASGSTALKRLSSSVYIFAFLIFSLLALLPAQAGAQNVPGGAVFVLDIKGAIGFAAAAQLEKALGQAQAQNAVLVVRLDTPGGLVSSTRDMTRAILGARTPVVVYVAPTGARAASAGTYLVYASHLAAMAPGTHLGAATPIPLGPGLPGAPPSKPGSEKDKSPDADPADAAGRKSLNDAIAYIRTLAQLRNRNAQWAEKAVREAATLTATEAEKENVIEVIAASVEDLLTKIDGRTVTTSAGQVKLETRGRRVVEIEADWKTRFLSAITDPNIAFILLLIGIYGILFEFWSPGAIAPGVIGGISLIVALAALSVLPVNFAGLALLLLGIAFMVAEAFTPGIGLLGLGGLVAFVIGALFLFDPVAPDVPLEISRPLIAGAAIASAAFLVGVLGLAVSARRRPVHSGADTMINSTGEVLAWSDGKGEVWIQGERWLARSDSPLNVGDKVRILRRTGLTLSVQPLDQGEIETCKTQRH
jgi:membrane-bound serine protease (ClpP class)